MHRRLEDRAKRGGAPKVATKIGPVMAYMEDVVTDLLAGHGCRHSIAMLERVRDQINAILKELVAINTADERVELKALVSLRQSFIVLNTTAVIQNGRPVWEFQNPLTPPRSPARGALQRSERERTPSPLCSLSITGGSYRWCWCVGPLRSAGSLPDIGTADSPSSHSSVFDRLQSSAPGGKEEDAEDPSFELERELEEEREMRRGLRRLLKSRDNEVQSRDAMVSRRETQWQAALEEASSKDEKLSQLQVGTQSSQ
jgi:hypothetical protein